MLAVRDANSERITKCFTEKNLHLKRGDEFTLVVKTNPKLQGLSSSYKTYQYKVKGNQNNWWIRRSGFWGTLSSYFGSARQDCLFLSQKMNELQQQGKLSDIGTSPKELKLYSVAGNGTCLFRTLVAFHTKNSAWFTQMSQAQLKGFVCKTEYKKKVCTAITRAIHSSLEMSGTGLSENLRKELANKLFGLSISQDEFSLSYLDRVQELLNILKLEHGSLADKLKESTNLRMLADGIASNFNHFLIEEFNTTRLKEPGENEFVDFSKPLVVHQPNHFEALGLSSYFSSSPDNRNTYGTI